MKNKKTIILFIAIAIIIAIGVVIALDLFDQIDSLEEAMDDLETEIIMLNN